MICPKLAELEMSFIEWTERIIRLGRELNIPIDLYATTSTFEKWGKIAESRRYAGHTKLYEIDET